MNETLRNLLSFVISRRGGLRKRTWVTKYGYPETRELVEHDDDECAACQVAGPLADGDVIYVEVEQPDGSTIVRRVEGRGRVRGFFARLPFSIGWVRDETPIVECRIVSREQVDREIAEARAGGWYHEER